MPLVVQLFNQPLAFLFKPTAEQGSEQIATAHWFVTLQELGQQQRLFGYQMLSTNQSHVANARGQQAEEKDGSIETNNGSEFFILGEFVKNRSGDAGEHLLISTECCDKSFCSTIRGTFNVNP